MPRQIRSIPQRRPAGRSLVGWSAFDSGTVVATLAGTSVALISLGIPALPEQTILRTRGEFLVSTDQSAATEHIFGAWGLAVVSEEAAAIGITAVPTPITDQDSDLWFAWVPFHAGLRFGTNVAFQNVIERYTIDSKAMRKLSGNQRIVEVIENNASAQGLVFHICFRLLSKFGRG